MAFMTSGKKLMEDTIEMAVGYGSKAKKAFVEQRSVRELSSGMVEFASRQSARRKVAAGVTTLGIGGLALRSRSQGIGMSSGAQGVPPGNSSGAGSNNPLY